jgi:hypothetical protein
MIIIYGVYPEWCEPIGYFSTEEAAQEIADKLNEIRGEEFYGVCIQLMDQTLEEILECNVVITAQQLKEQKEKHEAFCASLKEEIKDVCI